MVHLQPGDAVRVRDFDRDGKIVRLRLEQQRAEVDVGAFSVEVPLGDVLPPEVPPPPPRPPRRPPEPVVVKPARRGGARPVPVPAGPPPSRLPVTPVVRDVPRPELALPALTAEQAAALKPEDKVYVRRFRREGRIVRVKPGKQIALVDVGLLEVEVPFEGLALPAKQERPPRARPPAPRPGPEHEVPAATLEAGASPEAAAAPTDGGAEVPPIAPPSEAGATPGQVNDNRAE